MTAIIREVLFSYSIKKLLTTPLAKFCPQKSCPYCELTNNKITKDGTYLVKTTGERRQVFYCHGGEHNFSEMAYSLASK